jgi:hypothetical protein
MQAATTMAGIAKPTAASSCPSKTAYTAPDTRATPSALMRKVRICWSLDVDRVREATVPTLVAGTVS